MVAAAVIGTVTAAGLGAAVTNSASRRAANASQDATDANVALQREILGLQQANSATSRAVGNAALMQLAQRYGLDVGQVAQTAQGLGVPVEGYSGGAQAPASAQNWGDYLQSYPDVAAEYQRQLTVKNGPKSLAEKGITSPESFAAWHYSTVGQQEGRQPPASPQAPASTAAVDPTSSPAAPIAPASQASTAATDIDQNGYYTGVRPTVEAAPTYVAPTYRETAVAPLDVSLGKYEKSPDYEFQLDQGNKNILANASATGGLESGAALKRLQEYGQNLALGDYSQWRGYVTGQHNNDRAFTANRDDAYNAFGQSTALAKFGADQGNYQYGTNLGQSIFNTNRDYATNRYDANTSALMGLAGYGQQASSANSGALSSYGSNVGNAYFANADNQGGAAMAGAGQINNLISGAGGALALYYGNRNGAANQAPSASAPSALSYNSSAYEGIY